MTASERSFVGLAKQTAKGTPNTTDSDFQYMLFTDGSVGPNNIFLPLDQEVGGGAMLRDVKKVGVSSGGGFTIIPRPTILGHFLLGALGEAAAPAQQGASAAYAHAFSLPSDQFAAPYFTVRSSPGGMWGEQFQDCRIAALGFNWRSPDFIRGSVAFLGGLPTPNISTASWNAAAYVDGGPQFLSAVTAIELPTGASAKALSGSFVAGMAIPLDEQWVTGSYQPDDFDINSRSFVLSLVLKIADKSLYNKMSYDPADGAAWTAAIFREANFLLKFQSDVEVDAGYPYSLQVAANGQTGADANVTWSVTPVALKAGRQVTIVATGTYLADPLGLDPVTVTLINGQSTQY